MKYRLPIFLVLVTASFNFLFAVPRVSFSDLLIQAELNPKTQIDARNLAVSRGLALNILSRDGIMIDAKGIEDGEVVYAVFTDMLDVYHGGFTAYYKEALRVICPENSRFDYGNGKVVDNAGGYFDPVYEHFSGTDRYLMCPDWTGDQVYLFNVANGNLVENSFIPTTNPELQSPKHALQHPNYKQIVISDQLSDVVQRFDTNGTYLGFFAPKTGVNLTIVDNMRGIAFRSNNNLLVTVASGTSANTIQQFDSSGTHIGAFISSNVNSPFDILFRANDILVSNSGGDDITRFSLTGTFLSVFQSGTNVSFAQQMHQLPNGFIAVSSFSTPNSGLALLDASGNYIRTMAAVTGNRGVYLLGNGHYLVANSTGVHELDSATGTLIRTVTTGANFQYLSYYNPDAIVSSGNANSNIPETFALFANYPNPFNPKTNIKYQMPVNGPVKITVFDLSGREVGILVNEMKRAGTYEVSFDGSRLASGVYYYKMETDGYTETMKMVMVK
jgi:Secretion system C-terminal sorting domain